MRREVRHAGRAVTRAARSVLRTGGALGLDLLRAATWVRPTRRPPPGTAPGTLIADPQAPPPIVRMMAWGPDGIVEADGFDEARVAEWRAKWPVFWVDVEGLGDIPLIERLGEIFGLHRLDLEDVVNTGQRAKIERHPGYAYIVCQLMRLEDGVSVEQLSLFLGKDFVLTFQERRGDSFEPVRGRAHGGLGRIRVGGCGYLAYAIVDTVVDHYFPILETLGERLDVLEDEIVQHPSEDTMTDIHDVRRNLMVLRRSVWPLRETMSGLSREPGELFEDDDRPYLQDVYDHAIQVMDLIENYREIGSGLMDIYLSSLSHRMNEVMKVLTMFATIFIPLGFIAGLYGMNFDSTRSPWNMPELGWRYGYPFALALMALVAAGLLTYFTRRGWIGRGGGLGRVRRDSGDPGRGDGEEPGGR